MITEIDWKMKSSMNMSTYHHSLRRNDEYGVQMETVTQKLNGYGSGKSDTSFYIDKDEREFKTEEDLISAYNEKFKFDDENPEHEVTYVKVIKKRQPWTYNNSKTRW